MSTMTLEQMESELRRCVSSGHTINLFSCQRMADAIDAEIKARGEPVAEVMDELGFPIMTWLPTNVIDWPVGTKLYTAPPTPKIETLIAPIQIILNKWGCIVGATELRAALEAALKETP